MHPPSFEVSESDPQYSLKSFIGNIILKAELLMEIEDFLCGSAHDFEPKPDEIHDHADPLRDYLDRHTDYIRSYVAYHEDLMLKLVRVNASLLHDAVACARWEMTSTTLDPEAAQEYATDICVLAQEAVDMDEHSGFDGMEGRCKRLREIMREATEIMKLVDECSNKYGVNDCLEEIGAHMKRLKLR